MDAKAKGLLVLTILLGTVAAGVMVVPGIAEPIMQRIRDQEQLQDQSCDMNCTCSCDECFAYRNGNNTFCYQNRNGNCTGCQGLGPRTCNRGACNGSGSGQSDNEGLNCYRSRRRLG